jgi:parallel beta-helix repeat protein
MNTKALAISALALTTLAAHAGPLDPPSGTIAPTMKTLDQVEPRIPLNQDTTPGDTDSVLKIAQSGSYYLAADLRILSFGDPRHAIEITAPNVTLDLSGYSLISLLGTLDGIRLGPNVENVTIINGSIIGFSSGDGIDGSTNSTSRITIRDMRIVDCANGITLTDRSRVEDCTISGHTTWGISTGSRARISDNTVDDCGAVGIYNVDGMDACIIEDNTLSGNARGFFVYGLRNVIVRNYVSDSTVLNWDCNSGNHMLVINATDSTFAVGDAGGSSFGTTNPNANYSH